MIIAINGHGQSFCFKETQLVHKLTQSGRAFKGNPFLYFQFEDFKGFQLFKFKFLDLEKIAIQRQGK